MKTILFSIMLLSAASAQNPAGQQPSGPPPANQPAQAPAPLSTPAVTGPLQAAPPLTFDAGPFGKIALDGVLSGIGLWQSNPVPGDDHTQAALSNGQIFLQKTDGWFQFYVQAGAYDIPSLGVPFLQTDKTISNLYGPLPVGFLRLVLGKNTSILVGALPTLIGAEYTFSFENMNVQRGLLWNQENAVTRGIQVNQSVGKFSASLSWNDGFYSNRYSWLSGSLGYSNGPHSLAFVAAGNFGQTAYQTFATPVQNNSSIYDIIYTYNKGSWIVQPYYQYTNVPTNRKIGIEKGNSTQAGAVLASYKFTDHFSLAGRWEYIASTGSEKNQSVNLIYGPRSTASSYTLTPTFQYGRFFVRGDLSWVHVTDFTPGSVFGSSGGNNDQPRAVGEIGFLF